MNHALSSILDEHERVDKMQRVDERVFLCAVEREFFNSGEVLRAAKAAHINVKDCISGRVSDLPVLPIRTCSEFYVKKHTTSQIPYMHGHDFYELIYVISGKCVQCFPDRPPLTLGEGQCCLLAPGAVHSLGKSNPSDAILKFVIPSQLFAFTGGQVLGNLTKGGVAVFTATPPEALFAALKLLQLCSGETAFKDVLVRSYLSVLFASLATPKEQLCAIAIQLGSYLNYNLNSASLSDLAARLGYNANYLGRLIKTRTGKSFSQHLAQRRMEYASRLLVSTDLPIEEIACRAGYAGASGFYKQFVSFTSMKPSEYRSLISKK